MRKDILDLLQKRLLDFQEGYRQNVAILGEELIGKTTILKKFLDGCQAPQIIPVYVEILPQEFPLFVKRCLNSLLFNDLKSRQLLSSRENLDILIKRTHESLPQTALAAETLLKKIDKEKPEKLFAELFDLIELFSAEAERKIVIVFDEFHHLKTLGYDNICRDLGKRIMLQKNSLFIFASSHKALAKEILINDLSLLFGNFETQELESMKGTDSGKIIFKVFDDIFVSKDLVNFLIYFTGGHPFYLKIVSEEATLACRAARKEALDIPTLIRTLEKLLFHEWGVFHLKFTLRLAPFTTVRSKNDVLYLLDAVALGKNRLKDMTSHLRQARAQVQQKCHKLVEAGILSKNGSFYVINDRLMSFWLKYAHAEKLNSLSHDFSEQIIHFQTQVQKEIESFIQVSQKSVGDRMMDIFNQFEGDEIQFGRKKFQLDAFQELKMISFDQSSLRTGIFGKTQGHFWITAIKEDGITEHDVNEFINMAKSFKQKTVQKILIGLGDIERNARLLAKESSIATWDIENLNSLFDIYGKPRIIR